MNSCAARRGVGAGGDRGLGSQFLKYIAHRLSRATSLRRRSRWNRHGRREEDNSHRLGQRAQPEALPRRAAGPRLRHPRDPRRQGSARAGPQQPSQPHSHGHPASRGVGPQGDQVAQGGQRLARHTRDRGDRLRYEGRRGAHPRGRLRSFLSPATGAGRTATAPGPASSAGCHSVRTCSRMRCCLLRWCWVTPAICVGCRG